MRAQGFQICVALLLVGLGSGCATSVPERDRGAYAGAQGDAAELVFSGHAVLTRVGAEPGWEFARRDLDLGARHPVAPTATNQWPTRQRPSLDQARRIYLRSDSRSIIYFGDDRPGEGYRSGGAPIGRPYY